MRALNVILALAVSLLIAFGVAEGGLRLLGYGPPKLNTQFDAERGWSKTPLSTIHRSTGEYDVTIDDGDARATATLTFTNRAPTSGLPDAVIANNDQGFPPGTNVEGYKKRASKRTQR